MNKPEISVIICCYNGEKTIYKCLESLFNQKLDGYFEVIIVDDGSIDSTSKEINKFINKFDPNNNIFKYNRKKNEGLSIARNYGILKSSSEIISFVDEDSLLMDGYLQSILKCFKNSNKYNCLGGKTVLYNDNSKFARLIQDSIFSYEMQSENAVIGTNMSFKKSFLLEVDGFQSEFTYRGDESLLFAKSSQ